MTYFPEYHKSIAFISFEDPDNRLWEEFLEECKFPLLLETPDNAPSFYQKLHLYSVSDFCVDDLKLQSPLDTNTVCYNFRTLDTDTTFQITHAPLGPMTLEGHLSEEEKSFFFTKENKTSNGYYKTSYFLILFADFLLKRYQEQIPDITTPIHPIY